MTSPFIAKRRNGRFCLKLESGNHPRNAMTRKPPPKTAPSARKPARAGRAAPRAHRKSAPSRRRVCRAAKSPRQPSRSSRTEGAPRAEADRDRRRCAASHKTRRTPALRRAESRRGNGLPEDRQSQLKLLIARGKEQGYLTYAAGQRPPAVRDRRSGADRRHRQHDQRHGHPGVREGTGCRVAAAARAALAADDEADRGSRRRAAPRSTPSSAARPTRCACTCARWARSSC